MTSLLVAVRENAEVDKTSLAILRRLECPHAGTGVICSLCPKFIAEHDAALLRAAVREIAKRVRAESRAWKRNKALWMPDAIVDFIEGSLE